MRISVRMEDSLLSLIPIRNEFCGLSSIVTLWRLRPRRQIIKHARHARCFQLVKRNLALLAERLRFGARRKCNRRKAAPSAGTTPSMVSSRSIFFTSATVSFGTDLSKPSVYGCFGRANNSSQRFFDNSSRILRPRGLRLLPHAEIVRDKITPTRESVLFVRSSRICA